MSGGLFGYFGIRDWFFSLPKNDQNKIFAAYTNSTTNPDDLINGSVSYTSNTAAKLIAFLAYNIFSSKDHVLSSLLLNKAIELIKTKDDYDQCLAISNRISDERKFIPDQRDIDRYKQKVLTKILESPGILQSDIRKLFSESMEHIVGHALSQLNHEGKLHREKKGRSFQLYVAN